MKLDAVLNKLCELTPPLMDQCGWWMTKSRCIAATRVGVETLRSLGYEAEPCAVLVQAANKEFLRLGPRVRDGKMSAEEAKRRGARLLVIDDNPNSELGGYPAHLVVLLKKEGMMVDLDIGQFKRPGIEVPRAHSMYVTPEFASGAGDVLYELPNDAVIMFKRMKKVPDWRTAPDWNEERRWRRVVRRLVDQLKETHESER